MKRRHWDFGYEPSGASYPTVPAELGTPLDVVIATRAPLDEATARRALGAWGADLDLEPLIARAPGALARARRRPGSLSKLRFSLP